MSQTAVIIVEQSEVVAKILCNVLATDNCRCAVVQNPAMFEETCRAQAPVGLILVDVMAVARDETGREVPFWKLLVQRMPVPVPVLCFSGTNSTPTDTPLFTAPPETMTIASPQDFRAVAHIVQAYLSVFTRQPQVLAAIAGTLLPSLRGSLEEFDLESITKLIELGDHCGVLLLRDRLQIGLIAFEHGQPVHAMVGSSIGKDAVITIFNSWRQAQFIFCRDILLGEHTISHGLENLILEASRLGDEVSDLVANLPPQSYLRRVKGYTDQLPGKRLTLPEWEVLSMVDRYHIVSELINRARMSEIVVMKALRALIQKHLVEIVTADHPEYSLAQRV